MKRFSTIMEHMIAVENDAESLAQSACLDQLDVSDVDRFKDGTHSPFFARLRREAPIHFCSQSPYGSYWSITKADDITLINADHRRFSSNKNVIIGDIPESFKFPAFMVSDPPEHGKWRKVVAGVLSRSTLAELEKPCRKNIRQMLDTLPKGVPFNWVERVSKKLTRWMIGALFALNDDDIKQIVRWSDLLMMPEADSLQHEAYDERCTQLANFEAFITQLAAERSNCDPRRELVAALINGPHGSEMLKNPNHFMGTVSLLVGANETTHSAASAAIVAFARYPEEWAKLSLHPSLVKGAVQEIIRWQTPLAHMRRTATENVEIRGKLIKKGDRVVIWYCSANQDEAVFSDAKAFRIDRINARHHLSYGHGIHRCVGRYAAEMQLHILLEEMLELFQTVNLVEMPWRTKSNYFSGYEKLVVVVN